ncbi:MAG: bifunctional transaldolase/phosoglucose isomerase [Vicinamibacterales bacterium]
MAASNRSNADAASAGNPLKGLLDFGQSVWLDYIRRDLMTTGELARLVSEDGLRGMTSNPAIFEKAIAGDAQYQSKVAALRMHGVTSPLALYEALAIEDIQLAVDAIRGVYDASACRDGYVSLEVSPFLARDTAGTLAEARRLWTAVDRPNLMIKVPATDEGLPAIERLIAEGINVNVTLLFAVERYEAVARAFIAGLEAYAASHDDVGRIASVASFFVSRIDTMIDARLAALASEAADSARRAEIEALAGTVAIANAKLAYQSYRRLFDGPRWQALAGRGAQVQRLLWASTSTKNPKYRDVLYVEELIGPDTVNTIPPATFDAFRDHGRLRQSLAEDVEAASATMATLARVGISMPEVTAALLDEGLRLFVEPFDKLLRTLDPADRLAAGDVNPQTCRMPAALAQQVSAALADWQARGKVWRLWAGDRALWTNADEDRWLGWMSIVGEQLAQVQLFASIAEDVAAGGFTDLVLLGMGGSSLAPEVLAMTFGRKAGAPTLHVLDSTDPAQVAAVERRANLAHTLFIVSSKSGSTLEPNIFKDYFFERAAAILGRARAGSHFIAVTDPGSSLDRAAQADGFRRIYHGKPSIGGRYSALSHFGMVPAAALGVDVPRFLELTSAMVRACSGSTPVADNPGVHLGLVLGLAARAGRDKVTFIASPGVSALGGWLEQLIAESTGKNGQAVIPVDGERLGDPATYGDDRVFVYLRLESAALVEQDAAVIALEQSGAPVVSVSIGGPYMLGQEFFRWEMATAVAGAVMGLNPFDQPDVEASKIATRRLTTAYEEHGTLPGETPLWADGVTTIYAEAAYGERLRATVSGFGTLDQFLRAHLSTLQPHDYFALLAYVEMNEWNGRALQEVRDLVRARTRVATCVGFGPRFLHSTGQAYKGGPNTGVFVQLTCDDAVDVDVPGHKYSFGVVKAAQARGDFEVLASRGRRLLRVHLGGDVANGLSTFKHAVMAALR